MQRAYLIRTIQARYVNSSSNLFVAHASFLFLFHLFVMFESRQRPKVDHHQSWQKKYKKNKYKNAVKSMKIGQNKTVNILEKTN